MGTSTEPYYRDVDHVSSTGAFLLEKPMGDLLKSMIASSRDRSSNPSPQNSQKTMRSGGEAEENYSPKYPTVLYKSER
jgi:hypothetical protein